MPNARPHRPAPPSVGLALLRLHLAVTAPLALLVGLAALGVPLPAFTAALAAAALLGIASARRLTRDLLVAAQVRTPRQAQAWLPVSRRR